MIILSKNMKNKVNSLAREGGLGHKKGILIAIEGSDSSGKETQTKLLAQKLKKEGLKVKTISFPRYKEKSSFAIVKYLSGKYGKTDEISARQASLFYALDRFDAKQKIKKWLKEKYIVIADRYTGSNMAHQGAKTKNKKELKQFLLWLYSLEYDTLKIPKPDINILLHVNSNIIKKIIKKKKKKDAHEKNFKYLKKVAKTYLEIAKKNKKIKIIECVKNNKLLPAEEINKILYKKIKNY